MAAEFFDYDETNGLRTDTEEADGIMVVHRTQDFSALLEKAKAERDSGVNDDSRFEGFGPKVATVPAVVELDLLNHGIKLRDLNQPSVLRKFQSFMREKYPYLLTSNKRFA
jgi:hypothetical protein